MQGEGEGSDAIPNDQDGFPSLLLPGSVLGSRAVSNGKKQMQGHESTESESSRLPEPSLEE